MFIKVEKYLILLAKCFQCI